jgi:hypothetical protein
MSARKPVTFIDMDQYMQPQKSAGPSRQQTGPPKIADLEKNYVGNLWWTSASSEGLRSFLWPNSSIYVDELHWPSYLREVVESAVGSTDVRSTRASLHPAAAPFAAVISLSSCPK